MLKRYKELRYIFRDSIEVYEYLDGKYGAPGMERSKKKKPTPEQIQNRNQWNRERKARHKLKANFHENDYLVTLTYRRSDRPPDMKTTKKHFSDFCKEVRKKYKKAEFQFKWMRNIEVGSRGGWHIHVVVNRIPDADLILKKAWPHGGVQFKHLYEQGEFADLAGYMTKTPETAKRYGESLVETDYSTSRNLPVPDPIPRRLAKWKKDPKPKEGYYIDKNTFYEGINPVTGYKYRYYTMIRLHRRI